MLSRVLLVDGSQLLYRAAFSRGREIGTKEPVFGRGTVAIMVALLRRAVYRFVPLSVIVVWDGKRSLRRQEILPTYKITNRLPPPEDQSQRRWMDLGLAAQIFTRLGCRSVLLPSKEADDVIGYLARKVQSPIIVSSDKDFLQLVQYGCSVWFPDSDKYISGVNFYEEFGVLPKQYLLYKAIIGDPGDAIPGVRGLGPKTVLPLLQEDPSSLTFDTLAEVLRRDRPLQAREATLLGAAEIVRRNMLLMDLSLEVFYDNEIEILDQCLCDNILLKEDSLDELVKLGISGVAQMWYEWSAPFRRLC